MNNDRLKVLIIPESLNWILGKYAKEIARWNPQYDCQIIPSIFIKNHLKKFTNISRRFDLIHYLLPQPFLEINETLGNNCACVCALHHIVNWQEIKRVALADAIMVGSTEWRDFIEERGVPSSRIVLVPGGVDTDKFIPPAVSEKQKIRKQLGIPDKAFVIGSFGHQSPYVFGRKGGDIFIEAINSLATKINNLAVLIVGFGWKNIVRKIKSRKLHVTYIVFGYEKDLPRYYKALDCYWITSRIEGGPIPLLESMSSAIPVITTPVGLAKDIVIDGENALVVQKDNPAGFCEKTLGLIRSRALRDRLAEKGRETVLRKCHWNHFSKSIPILYEKALANRSVKMATRSLGSEKNLIIKRLQNDIKNIEIEDTINLIRFIRKAGDCAQADKMQLRLWMKYPLSVIPLNPIASFLSAARYNHTIRRIFHKKPI